MSYISTQLDPARIADLSRDPLWAPRQVNMPAATVAYAELHAARAIKAFRFAQTYCSQCGCECGPGDAGVSSCKDYLKLQTPMHYSAPGTLYAEFNSSFLGGNVRIGYEWDEPASHAHYPQTAGAELTEVWIGGLDMGHHLTDMCASILQDELAAHLRDKADWERAA